MKQCVGFLGADDEIGGALVQKECGINTGVTMAPGAPDNYSIKAFIEVPDIIILLTCQRPGLLRNSRL